jgi:hypothetical protein
VAHWGGPPQWGSRVAGSQRRPIEGKGNVLAGLVEEFPRVSLVLTEVVEAGFHGQGSSVMVGAHGGNGRRWRNGLR